MVRSYYAGRDIYNRLLKKPKKKKTSRFNKRSIICEITQIHACYLINVTSAMI